MWSYIGKALIIAIIISLIFWLFYGIFIFSLTFIETINNIQSGFNNYYQY